MDLGLADKVVQYVIANNWAQVVFAWMMLPPLLLRLVYPPAQDFATDTWQARRGAIEHHLGRIHAAAHEALLEHRQMLPELVVQFLVQPGSAERSANS